MTVYSITGGSESTRYVATKREALTLAREASAERENADAPFEVEKVWLLQFDRALILQVLNQLGGYVERTEQIAVFVNGARQRA